MINYCSRLSSKQRLLPTLNPLAAPFLAFPFPFYYRFGLFRYRFVSVFTDIFVFVNGICLYPFLRFFVSVYVNVNYTVSNAPRWHVSMWEAFFVATGYMRGVRRCVDVWMCQVWLQSYKTLFSTSCHRCNRLLIDNMPPTWRDFQTLDAYHEQCRP